MYTSGLFSVGLVDVMEGHLKGCRGKRLRDVAIGAVGCRGDGGVLLQGGQGGRVGGVSREWNVACPIQACGQAGHIMGHSIHRSDGATLCERDTSTSISISISISSSEPSRVNLICIEIHICSAKADA